MLNLSVQNRSTGYIIHPAMLLNRVTTFFIGISFLHMLSCDSPSAESKATNAAQSTEAHNLNPAFWDYAVSSSLLQAELGRLAMEKGTTEQVKDWGKKANSFHNKALQQLKKIGSGHAAIQLPDSLVGADKRMVDEFSALQGAAFDARYREHILISHKSQLSRYEEASKRTDSPGLIKWLANMQQHMQDQLQKIAHADSSGTIGQ